MQFKRQINPENVRIMYFFSEPPDMYIALRSANVFLCCTTDPVLNLGPSGQSLQHLLVCSISVCHQKPQNTQIFSFSNLLAKIHVTSTYKMQLQRYRYNQLQYAVTWQSTNVDAKWEWTWMENINMTPPSSRCLYAFSSSYTLFGREQSYSRHGKPTVPTTGQGFTLA